MAEKIRIKAAKDAPDVVAHGNFTAEKKNGHYATENRRFADHLIAAGYGEEVEEKAATPAKEDVNNG